MQVKVLVDSLKVTSKAERGSASDKNLQPRGNALG